MKDLLKGIKVLDFTRLLPGPLAGHFLADMGAEVYKIEIPNNYDYIYKQMPFDDETGLSTLWRLLNEQKEILELNFRDKDNEEAQKKLHQLLSDADILIEQYRPEVMALWGLDYASLKEKYPHLIYISVTGYGQEGLLVQEAGHDLTYLAYAGLLDLNRDERGKPVVPNVQFADIAGGSYMAVSACLGALYEREKTSKGQWIDVSMMNGVLPITSFALAQQFGGWNPNDLKILGGGLVNYNVYECADGKWVALAALEIKFWVNFCEWAEREDWSKDNLMELSIHVFPKHEIDTFFKAKTRDEWITLAKNKDVCLAPILEVVELDKHPKHIERDVWIRDEKGKSYSMHYPLKRLDKPN